MKNVAALPKNARVRRVLDALSTQDDNAITLAWVALTPQEQQIVGYILLALIDSTLALTISSLAA